MGITPPPPAFTNRLIARIAAPQVGLAAGGTLVQWTVAESDPHGWLDTPSTNLGPLPAGTYDVGYWFLTSTATGAKSVLLAVGADTPYGVNHGAIQQMSGFFPDVAVDEGESIALAITAASAANLNGARVVVRRSGDPFGLTP